MVHWGSEVAGLGGTLVWGSPCKGARVSVLRQLEGVCLCGGLGMGRQLQLVTGNGGFWQPEQERRCTAVQ